VRPCDRCCRSHRRSARVGSARRDCAPLPALLDGPDRGIPRTAAADGGPETELRAASVDTDSYGFMLAGFLITMGTLGRPDRSPAAAADRRRRLRGRFTTGRVRDQRRDADRGARSARDRCGNPGALDLVVDPGLHVAAIVGAALAIAIAILSAKVLRRAQPAPEADTDPPPRKNDRPRRRSRRTFQAAETAAAAVPTRRKEVPDGPSGS
jgi:hypothetical protein